MNSKYGCIDFCISVSCSLDKYPEVIWINIYKISVSILFLEIYKMLSSVVVLV